ncbi:MAG: translation initiation factor IF-2 subunit gamma [archaeon]
MVEKEPLQAEVNIGMIGHVDHGKTTITSALTGKWTDTHSEELKRGISIRLGYADAIFRKCVNCGEYTSEKKCSCGGTTKILRKVSFVDAPGHETLMTTMLSGATLMNGAILVIAANEKCPQPRTAEHLMALKVSETKNIVVAQNKIDLVSREEALKNFNEIKTFLEKNGYTDILIIPVAANQKLNLSALIQATEKVIITPKHSGKEKLKMFVVRSFDANKPGSEIKDLFGGVLGGSIVSGKIKENQEIIISPGLDGKLLKSKVKSLSAGSQKLKEGFPGGLIAIGTELDPSLTKNDQMKGQIIAEPGVLPEPKTELQMNYVLLERLLKEEINCKLSLNEPIVLTIGTNTTIGVITKIEKNLITVKTRNPVVAVKDERIAISKKDKGAWRLIAYGKTN